MASAQLMLTPGKISHIKEIGCTLFSLHEKISLCQTFQGHYVTLRITYLQARPSVTERIPAVSELCSNNGQKCGIQAKQHSYLKLKTGKKYQVFWDGTWVVIEKENTLAVLPTAHSRNVSAIFTMITDTMTVFLANHVITSNKGVK